MAIPDCYWNEPADSLLSELSTSPAGLSPEEAQLRLGESGPNSLAAKTEQGKLILFLRQFKSPITLLLIVSALLSFFLGERTDAFIILFILLVSAVLGFYQENSAAGALRQLLQLVQVDATVLRSGTECKLPLAETVAGDIVLLGAGNTVPGDCRLLESKDLFTNEATLTGETFPVEKSCGVIPAAAALPQRTNSLFMGTHVISGTALALIVRTGTHTEFGAISSRLRHLQPETEFERGIRRFGYLLLEVTLLLVLIIFCINVFLHKPVLDSFLFSLAIAVGLTPQLLPAIISINLSKGAFNMAKKSVIVKHLSAIENFGSMDVLCSDKTGTITRGEIILSDTLDPEGQPGPEVFRLAYLNAFFQKGFSNPIDQAICQHGQPTTNGLTKEDEVPYDFIRKRLSILVKGNLAGYLEGALPTIPSPAGDHDTAVTTTLVTKGAFDNVLAVCTQAKGPGGQTVAIDEVRDKLLQAYTRLSADGYRILGVAYKPFNDNHQGLKKEDETELIFAGLLLLTDPPKEDIATTIGELRALGISLKIITGDNALVARQVARVIGFSDPVLLTGAQIQDMNVDALSRLAPTTHIFAAVEPNQKEKILLALKKAGHVVGYMGDGINDAPALHAADVGISVNGAADVAKEAADIVLLGNDLKVLVHGVREGRKTFANTLKYIFMATSANFGNMFSMAGSSLFLSFLPLLPKQVLLTNLLTDVPEMTIATDRVDDAMTIAPRRIDLRFIRRFMIVFGLISSLFDYATFYVLLHFLHAGPAEFRTGWFMESVLSAVLIILVVRTARPFYKDRPGKYLLISTAFIAVLIFVLPYTPLAPILGFIPLPARFYPWLGVILLAYIASAETAKHLFYKKSESATFPLPPKHEP
jgi:P-type Mg2+ transporter